MPCADYFLLPEWAIERIYNELVIGAQLPTKDGRKCGNAHIVAMQPAFWNPDEILHTVLTDAGSEMRLTKEEVEELFYPPTFRAELSEILRKFRRQ